MNWKPITHLGISILLLLIVVTYASLNSDKILSPSITQDIQQEVKTTDDKYGSVSGAMDIGNPSNELYDVLKIVDGDTIKVSKLGTLRLIGIDTPETVDPRKDVQCFGVEASNKAKELLTGKKVRIELDSTQGATDKYGRTLAYVYTEEGINFNLLMIQEGYAFEYTYSTPYQYQTEFKQAQKSAKENNLGLWSSVCNY